MIEQVIVGLTGRWNARTGIVSSEECAAFAEGCRAIIGALSPKGSMSYVVTEYAPEVSQDRALVLRARARSIPEFLDRHIQREVDHRILLEYRGHSSEMVLCEMQDMPYELMRDMQGERLSVLTDALRKYHAVATG